VTAARAGPVAWWDGLENGLENMDREKDSSSSAPVTIVIVIGAIVLALYFAQQVLIPLSLATLLAFLLATPIRKMERLGVRRVPAVLLVVLIAFSFIFLLGWVVGRQVYSLAENATAYQTEIGHKLQRLRSSGVGFGARLEGVGKAIEKASVAPTTRKSPTAQQIVTPKEDLASASSTVSSPSAEQNQTHLAPGTSASNPLYAIVLPASESPVRVVATYLGLALGPLGTAGVVLIFVIFILLEREDLRDRLIWLISRGNYTVTTKALDDAATRIGRYMVAQSIVNGTYGVVVAAGLWLIGATLGHGVAFPSFVLWGLLCAVLRFLPYIGPWVAILFPLAISLAVYPGFSVFVATGALLAGVEVFSVNMMEPWLYGASTGLSTVAIMSAAVFWTWLWGPIGLLLATPMTVCTVVLGTHVTRLRFLSVMLSDQPALPRAVNFYQRLLAGDRIEAESVVREAVAKSGKDYAADRVIIPALRMARRDRKNDLLSAAAEAQLLDETEKVIQSICDAEATMPSSAADAGSERAPTTAPLPLILCCPAHHRAEELTLRLLQPIDYRVEVLSTRLLPTQVEALIEREKPAAIFVAVLPPGGLVQARYLCRRLRRRFGDLPMIVGYWGRAKNFDHLLVRLRAAGVTYVTTSMEQSQYQIKALLPSLSTASPPETGPNDGNAASVEVVKAS
jgi:predicted PurR-regulated permease PerM